MRLQRIFLSSFVCAVSALAASHPTPGIPQAQAALAGLPLRFETNQGQWNPEVLYAARSGEGNLFLTGQGPVLAGTQRRVEFSLLGGNRTPRLEPLDQLPARTDYYVGRREQWRRGISNFARVAYRSVYPGIDAIYYGTQEKLEYDFVVQPGADPNSIRLQFRGADRIHITSEGDLSVEAGGSEFVQKRPVIYQADPVTAARRPVQGRYRLLANGVVTVKLGRFDRSLPLVIDPVVTYSVFLGGASTDVINAVTTDAAGFVYVAGYTYSSNLTEVGPSVESAYSTGADAFVAMIDPNFTGAASLVYLTYLGGGRDDFANAILVDASGMIYVTGKTTSSDFPLAGANVQTTLALSTTSTSSVFPFDAFVTLIRPASGLAYSTYYGGTGNETPNGIALDQLGQIYILGTTDSTDLPVTANSFQAALSGITDVFLAVINVNSTALVYGTYIGGENDDDGRGLAVGPTGLVYFTASTYSQQFPMAGASYRTSLPGLEGVVVGVMDLTQSGSAALTYSTYLGGSVVDEVRGLSLDRQGRLLLTGWTLSNDFPVTFNAMQGVYGGAGNAFVLRVNPAAQPAAFLEYGSFIGGSGGDVAYGVTSDPYGNLYVTGYTESSDFPVTTSQYGSGIDAFLVEIDPNAAGSKALLFGTYVGGTGTHVGTGVVVGPLGAVYMAGYTGPDFAPPGLQNGYLGGGSDGFVMVFKQFQISVSESPAQLTRHTQPALHYGRLPLHPTLR